MRFENRLVLSAMAGINDAEFCRSQKAALVILGGFNADRKAIEAAEKVVSRGRKEFLFGKDGIEREIKALGRKVFAVNVRSATLSGFIDVAEIVDEYGGIIEINAHCRQREFVEAGCGEYLMFRHEGLLEIVRRVSRIAPTFVKIRGGYDLDYEKLAVKLFNSGCVAVHVDAMIPNGGCDLQLISRLSRLGNVIANNSFVDESSGVSMIRVGAKMASAARIVLKDRQFFEKMLRNPILSQPVEL